MKLNGIIVDDEFLISEVSEWEGKLKPLAIQIAKRYNMLTGDITTDIDKVDNVRRVLGDLRKNLPKYVVGNDPYATKDSVREAYVYKKDKTELLNQWVNKVFPELPMRVIQAVKNKQWDIVENYKNSLNEMQPPFEGEKTGFSKMKLGDKEIPMHDLVHREYTKHLGFADFEEQVKKVSKPSPVVYLVIGDIHEPYSHCDYLDHCANVCTKWAKRANAEFGAGQWELKVLFIGDEVDNHTLSYHEHNPDLPSGMDELTMAKIHLHQWDKMFAPIADEIIVIEGNHSALPKRKANTMGMASPYIKSYNEIYELPNWKFKEHHIDDQYMIHFHHGTKTTAGADIIYRALDEQMSQVCGDKHTKCLIEMANQHLFTMFVGCGIDTTSKAFSYAKDFKRKPVLSCSVIYDGNPILEPMKEI